MKTTRGVAIAVTFSIILCFSGTLYAADMDTTAQELSSNIAKEAGLTESEQTSIQRPVKEMLEQGADKDEIKNAVSDMVKRGSRGEQLTSSVGSMKDLVKKGKSPEEAGNIVSQTVDETPAEGLKGQDRVDNVQPGTQAKQTAKQTEKQGQQESTFEDKMGGSRDEGGSRGQQKGWLDEGRSPGDKGEGMGRQ